MVKVSGCSTNMERQKVSAYKNLQMEESTIIRSRMVSSTVTELLHAMMEEYIEESSKINSLTVMDSRSMKMTMSMTVNGIICTNTEKECSRRHQLEELKEDFMNGMKSKKSLK